MAQESAPQPTMHVPERFNVAAHLLDRHVEAGRGDRLALCCEDQRVRYGELLDRVARFGAGLRELGLRPEERLLLVCPDTADFVTAFLGSIRSAIVPIPVNTLLATRDYGRLLEDSRARGLVVHETLWPKLQPAASAARHLRHVILCGNPGTLTRHPGEEKDVPSKAVLSLDSVIDGAPAPGDPEDTSRDGMAFWLYSSGTTGAPKGVVHLHHDITVELEGYARGLLGLGEQDTTFSAAKLFFAYGLGNGLYFPLGVGGTAVLHPGKPAPDVLFAILAARHATVFFAVPTLYAAMLAWSESDEHAAAAREAMASVRLCVSAGEALPAPLFERWKDRFGVEILDGIGSTEMLHIFLSNRPGEVRAGSSGREVPGYRARIVDDAGRDVPDGTMGRLLVEGDSAAAFYWNRHEQSKATFQGSWCDTGDVYTRDEDGYLWHGGRADDMFKVKGMWVSPVEVESALVSHPAVLECAVVACKDPQGLGGAAAHVILREGRTPGEGLVRELREHTRRTLAPYKVPARIEFVASLPKTATGKIRRFRLREAGNLARPRGLNPPG